VPVQTDKLTMLATVGSALATLVAIAALASAMDMPPLPEPLAVLNERLPGLFRLHMVASGLTLLLLPWILLLRHRRSFHRLPGRVGAVLLLVGAATALPVALGSESPPIARAGFFAQGALCLVFLIEGVKAARARNVQRHAQLMSRVAALVFGAVVLRLMMAVAINFGLPFEPTYAAVAWLSWTLPLVFVSLWPWRHGLRRTSLGIAQSG
jgi:uncharacterized membrane protein